MDNLHFKVVELKAYANSEIFVNCICEDLRDGNLSFILSPSQAEGLKLGDVFSLTKIGD